MPEPTTPPATGESSQGTPTPTGGEGTAAPKGGEGDFNWGLFPDVPEDQREALQPHLKGVQGHVTKLEQQMAPLKPLLDQGLTHEQLAPLVQFDQALQQDPVGTWIRLAERIQQEGLMETLDLDSVKEIATGTGGEVETGEVAEGEDPRLAQALQEIQNLRSELDQDKTQRRQAQEDALLNKSLDTMVTQLGESGVPVPERESEGYQAFEKMLISALITNDGNPDQAISSIKSFREATLKGFTEKREESEEPAVSGEGPKPKGTRQRTRKGAWGDARKGAEQYLKRSAQTAQE